MNIRHISFVSLKKCPKNLGKNIRKVERSTFVSLFNIKQTFKNGKGEAFIIISISSMTKKLDKKMSRAYCCKDQHKIKTHNKFFYPYNHGLNNYKDTKP